MINLLLIYWQGQVNLPVFLLLGGEGGGAFEAFQGDMLHWWDEIDSPTPNFNPDMDLWHAHFYFISHMFASKV